MNRYRRSHESDTEASRKYRDHCRVTDTNLSSGYGVCPFPCLHKNERRNEGKRRPRVAVLLF